MAKSTIGEYFADVVISEEAGAAKPDKRIFDVAFSRMNNPKKEEVLIVGDSLTSDIKGGSDYGIDTCWFNPEQKPCDLDGEIHPMAGVVPGRAQMVGRLTMGYRLVEAIQDTPLLVRGGQTRGHEFHYSDWIDRPDGLPHAYEIAPRQGEPRTECRV